MDIGTAMLPDPSNTGRVQSDTGIYQYEIDPSGPIPSNGMIVFTGMFASGATISASNSFEMTLNRTYDNNPSNNTMNGTFTREQAAFDCGNVTDLSLAQCQALVDIYETNTGGNRSAMDGWNEALVE